MTPAQPTSAWPDESKPGWPLEPEKDGAHVLSYNEDEVQTPWEWSGHLSRWNMDGTWITPDRIVDFGWVYVSPVRTDADVAAAARLAAEAMREKAVKLSDGIRSGTTPASWGEHPEWVMALIAYEKALRALPLPSTAALDELRAQVRAEAFEECAAIARRGLHTPRAWLPETPTEAEAYSSLREAQEIEGAILARRGGAA